MWGVRLAHLCMFFFFSSRRRHTRLTCDWSSDVCSSDLMPGWMQPFARNQPVSVAVNAVRSLMQGGTKAVGLAHSTTYWVVLTAIWGLVILGTFGALSVRRFSKLR